MPSADLRRAVEPVLTPTVVESYLASIFRAPVHVLKLAPLGAIDDLDLKGYGFGTPVRVDYVLAGAPQSAVLETIAPGRFGHEHMADRARLLLWSHTANNRLPLHARSLDVGAFREGGALASLGDVHEFFILNEHVNRSLDVIELDDYASAPLRLIGVRSRWMTTSH